MKEKIYLASGNQHKKREIQELLGDYEIVTPKDEGIVFDPEETGTTFAENSLIKAKALWEIVKKPVIADDSGICVDCLGGEPGIYSSRFAGPDFIHGKSDGTKISQDEQNRFLISMSNEKEEGRHKCHYTCSLVMLYNPDRYDLIQETFEGELITDIKDQCGTGGFGYDPIVYLPEMGKMIAELTDDEKNLISHRGKAMAKLKKLLEK